MKRIFKMIIFVVLACFPALATCPSGMQELTSLTTRTTGDARVTNACYNPTTGLISFFTATNVGSSALVGTDMVVAAAPTVAQVNAGITILAGVTGRTLTVTDVMVKSIGGSPGTCTDVRVSSTAGSPVDFLVAPVAAIAQNVTLSPSTAASAGAGFGVAGVSGEGIQVRKTGGTCDTVTSFVVVVRYIASGR